MANTINRPALTMGGALGFTDQPHMAEMSTALVPTWSAKDDFLTGSSRPVHGEVTAFNNVTTRTMVEVPPGRQWRLLGGLFVATKLDAAIPVCGILITTKSGRTVYAWAPPPEVFAVAAYGFSSVHDFWIPLSNQKNLVLYEGWRISMVCYAWLGGGTKLAGANLDILVADLPGGPG